MNKQFTCSHGHCWELPIDGGLALAVAGVSCPECGAPAETMPPQTSPIKPGTGGAAAEADTKVPVGSSCPASVDTTPSQAAPVNRTDAATLPPLQRHLADQLPPALRDHPRYTVMALIGTGGMGAVYKAEHRVMNRPVALKVIRRSLLDQSGAIARFEREVKAAARLSHPNIVMAYDAEAAGDAHFLVMEFIEGVNLADVVAQNGPLAVRDACECVYQALQGLQHAHECGMIHRDLKPHNLMRTPSGAAKILDFGLARFVRETASDGPVTEVGTVMGTADFIAPEQATNAHDADIRADIYSLGCTLYHLLTGTPPFETGSALQKILQHMEAEPPGVESRRTDLPPGLSAVLRKMMAKQPEDRYQTPREAAEALAPFTRPATDLESPCSKAEARSTSGAIALSGSALVREDQPAARSPGAALPIGPPPANRTVLYWIPVAIAAATVLLALGLFFAPQVIRIVTNHGTLEIKIGDPSIEAKIRGGAVKIIDVATNQEYALSLKAGRQNIKAGEYRIEVATEAGVVVDTDEFKIERDGKRIVTVSLARSVATAGAAARRWAPRRLRRQRSRRRAPRRPWQLPPSPRNWPNNSKMHGPNIWACRSRSLTRLA